MRQIDFEETNSCPRIRKAKERKENTERKKNINTKRKPRGTKVNKMNQCESNKIKPKLGRKEKMKPTCLLRLCRASVGRCGVKMSPR